MASWRKRLWPQLDNIQLGYLIEHYETRAEAASDPDVIARAVRHGDMARAELQKRHEEES